MAVTGPAAPDSTLDGFTTVPPAGPRKRARHASARRVAAVGGIAGVVMLLVGACSVPPNTSRLISLINQYRSNVGVRQLAANWDLVNKAEGQTEAMAAAGHIFHSNLPSNNPYQWRALAENVTVVAVAQGVDQANFQFVNSPDHRANMGDGRFNYVGAAAYNDGRGNLWVVEEFMQL